MNRLFTTSLTLAFLGITVHVPVVTAKSSPFRDHLLLSRPAPEPRLDQFAKLERVVFYRYTPSRNEDLWGVSQRFQIDQFTLRSSNDIDETSIVKAGTMIRIPNRRGTLYEVRSPENLQTISRGFSKGKMLGAAYERQILAANDFPLPDLKEKDFPFPTGTILFLPDSWKPMGLQPPFSVRYQTSGFGSRRHPVLGVTRSHKGLDLARPYGSAVTVTREGVVTFAGWMGGYGNLVEVRHTMRNGRVRYTRYGHLSKISVRVGQRVRMYQLIGRVGSTGISTGPHLHFEVRDETGAARNPKRFF